MLAMNYTLTGRGSIYYAISLGLMVIFCVTTNGCASDLVVLPFNSSQLLAHSSMASTTTSAPGGTFFDSVKKSYADVPVDSSHGNAIETSAFLEASESLTTLFGTANLFLSSPL